MAASERVTSRPHDFKSSKRTSGEANVAKQRRARSSCKVAEAELIARLRQPLIAQFKKLGWECEAEDMAHDTLIILLDKLRHKAIREPKKIEAYCHGIAKKLSIAARRKIARRKTSPDTEAVAQIESDQIPLDAQIHHQRLQREVQSLINKLPVERDQIILQAMYIRGEDKAQVQDRLRVSSSQFDRVLYRSKKRLAALSAEHHLDAASVLTA